MLHTPYKFVRISEILVQVIENLQEPEIHNSCIIILENCTNVNPQGGFIDNYKGFRDGIKSHLDILNKYSSNSYIADLISALVPVISHPLYFYFWLGLERAVQNLEDADSYEFNRERVSYDNQSRSNWDTIDAHIRLSGLLLKSKGIDTDCIRIISNFKLVNDEIEKPKTVEDYEELFKVLIEAMSSDLFNILISGYFKSADFYFISSMNTITALENNYMILYNERHVDEIYADSKRTFMKYDDVFSGTEVFNLPYTGELERELAANLEDTVKQSKELMTDTPLSIPEVGKMDYSEYQGLSRFLLDKIEAVFGYISKFRNTDFMYYCESLRNRLIVILSMKINKYSKAMEIRELITWWMSSVEHLVNPKEDAFYLEIVNHFSRLILEFKKFGREGILHV